MSKETLNQSLNTVVDILHPVINKLIADEHDLLTLAIALATVTAHLAATCMGHDTFVHLLNGMHSSYDDAKADLEKVKQ